ncbi:MAG: vitamin B12-dependent ribonucleotide reductase, partial [bacterium]
ARDIFRKIADAAHFCGDPGMQYDTTINDWHTCSNTGRINASNPCSEYMHLDDSACNLASINLLKFSNAAGEFDTAGFRHAVNVLITAMDILIDSSSYPTPEIGVTAHKFRQLGLGYANLGALLMEMGLPYDSEKGRDFSAAVTALLSGEAYLQSTRLAKVRGPYEGYAV